MAIGGHVLTGSRALGLVGEFTGHILTGSGVGNRGLAPLIGHVITGAGHFIEIAGYMVQEAPVAYQRASDIFDRVQLVANRLQQPMAWPMPIPTNAPRDFVLAPNLPLRNIIPAGDVESSAWDRYMDNGGRQTMDTLKELGLSLGSAFSGDAQGAIEHGMAFIEKNQEEMRHMRDVLSERAAGRSGEGIVRDMGMIRHAGD